MPNEYLYAIKAQLHDAGFTTIWTQGYLAIRRPGLYNNYWIDIIDYDNAFPRHAYLMQRNGNWSERINMPALRTFALMEPGVAQDMVTGEWRYRRDMFDEFRFRYRAGDDTVIDEDTRFILALAGLLDLEIADAKSDQ